jgi:hypothetical protein
MFKSKAKGNRFESDAVDLLNEKIKGAKFKKIPGSGMLGTSFDEPLLTADVSGTVEGIKRKFKVECKNGYNSSTNKEVKQFTLKKEWLDKVIMEAKDALSTPLLIGKFSGARKGVQVFVVLDIDTFAYFINEISRLNKELDNEND